MAEESKTHKCILSLSQQEMWAALVCYTTYHMGIRYVVPMKDWCKHIHWWGKHFYFVDSLEPFTVDDDSCDRYWVICPICKAERPKEANQDIHQEKTIAENLLNQEGGFT